MPLAKYLSVVPAQAGTDCAKYTGLWNMGPRLRGDGNRLN
jgi:hypothetical protein